MMRLSTLFILTILCTYSSFAQLERSQNKLRIRSVQATIGASVDRYNDINLDHIKRTAENPADIEFDPTGYVETFGRRSVAPSFFLNLVLSPQELNNASLYNRSEWLIGMGFHGPREMRAGYSNEALDTTINFCNLSSERSLELAYMVNFFTSERSTLYAGLGGNFSTTRNNEVMIMGGQFIEDDEHPSMILSRPESRLTFKAKPLTHMRTFAVLGVNIFRNDRLDFNVQVRPGIGLQMIPDEPPKVIPYVGGINFGYRYYVSKRRANI